jgi:hypothetical protein
MTYTTGAPARPAVPAAAQLVRAIATAAAATFDAGELAAGLGLLVPVEVADAELALVQWQCAVDNWLAAGQPPGGPARLPGLAEPGGAERQWGVPVPVAAR